MFEKTIQPVGLPSTSMMLCLLAGLVLGGPASADNRASALLGDGASVTASEPSRMTQTGFLSDYARLRPSPAAEGAECWRTPDLDAQVFDKVLISRILVTLKPGEAKAVDPTDLKTLTDYFHQALVEALKPQMQVVEQPGPSVIVIRIALTDLVPTHVSRSVLGTIVPYGFVAEAGSGAATGRPAGSTPYLGETGIEMQFRDGGSEKTLAECRDTQIGRKYAAELDKGVAGAAKTWASGYLDSFDSWAYAKDAFDKWAAITAKRLAALRGVRPSS